MSSTENRVYQMSSSEAAAKVAIVTRYSRTVDTIAARRSLCLNAFARAAISMLATRRFRSHSHGASAVSSKSFTSNSRCRSGEPKSPKFDRCASPQAWTSKPLLGVPARSSAIVRAAPR